MLILADGLILVEANLVPTELIYLRPHPVRHDASEAGCPCEGGVTLVTQGVL